MYQQAQIVLGIMIVLTSMCFNDSGKTYPDQMSKSDYIAKVIDSLSIAVNENDVALIVKHAGDLTTNMQNARMPAEARKYLKIAFKYAEKDSTLLSEVYDRAGMLALSLSTNSNEKPIGIIDNVFMDSAIYWHKKGIEVGLRFNQKTKVGQNYRGLLQAMVHPHRQVLANSDSVNLIYKEGLKIATHLNDADLEFGLKKLMAVFLIKQKKYENAEVLMRDIVKNYVPQLSIDKMSINAWTFRLIARQNNLDTLIRLQEIFNRELVKSVAGEHNKLLYEADKEFETSITKERLLTTQSELSNRRNVIWGLSLFLLTLAILLIRLYILNVNNKKLVSRNELLVREQNHRVKNNLQMIASLLSLQAGKAQDPNSKEALKQSQGRIQAISLLNRSLYDHEEIGEVNVKNYISDLVTEVINSITDMEVEYRLNIEEVELDLEKTTSLGLIINELIVNSVKYVEKSLVSFDISLRSDEQKIILEYSDNGEDFDFEAYSQSRSFGKRLIELQSKQIGGHSTISKESGFIFSLSFT